MTQLEATDVASPAGVLRQQEQGDRERSGAKPGGLCHVIVQETTIMIGCLS
jgi:hypothetical protein